jgi:hypothetical protein
MASIGNYLSLVTSQHRGKPKFEAVVTANNAPLLASQNLALVISEMFDVDNAVGAQLDIVGLWVGLSRSVAIPLTGVYFAWNTSGLGWGQGVWKNMFDPTTGLVNLPDSVYRNALKAKILENYWDGTIPGIYAIWAAMFPPGGPALDGGVTDPSLDGALTDSDLDGVVTEAGADTTGIKVVDYGDMTMDVVFTGVPLDAATFSLFEAGVINIKPAGVSVTYIQE